jgi:hypothetical protein
MPFMSRADIEEASRIDLHIGGTWCDWSHKNQVGLFHERIAAGRKLNPYLRVLEFSVSAPYAYPGDATFPKDGWLLQPNGRFVDGWPGTRMINLLKGDVVDWLVSQCVRSVKERGFDGTFIDCMMPRFDWWACNIESQEDYAIDADENGKPDDRKWLDEQWAKAKGKLVERVREAVGPDALFMLNDGESDWERVLDRYLYWTEKCRKPTVTAIVSSSGIEPPFEAPTRLNVAEQTALLEKGKALVQRMRFGLTTTLMGDGYFAYDLHTRWRGQRWWYPEYDAPLGYPKGPAIRRPDGAWQRDYDGGSVIVNPTFLDKQVVFDDLIRDVSSGKIDRRFLIPIQDGRIFLPANEASRPGTLPEPEPAFLIDGKEPVVSRDDRILMRLGGAAAVFENTGRLRSFTTGKDELAGDVRVFITGAGQWKDFAYEAVEHRVESDGTLVFTNRRVHAGPTLACETRVSPVENGLRISSTLRALTDGDVHEARQQVDFGIRRYAGGRYQFAKSSGPIPAEPGDGRIAGPFERIKLDASSNPGIEVAFSGNAMLQDERPWGGTEYRAVMSFIRDTHFKKGDSWTLEVTLKTAR